MEEAKSRHYFYEKKLEECTGFVDGTIQVGIMAAQLAVYLFFVARLFRDYSSFIQGDVRKTIHAFTVLMLVRLIPASLRMYFKSDEAKNIANMAFLDELVSFAIWFTAWLLFDYMLFRLKKIEIIWRSDLKESMTDNGRTATRIKTYSNCRKIYLGFMFGIFVLAILFYFLVVFNVTIDETDKTACEIEQKRERGFSLTAIITGAGVFVFQTFMLIYWYRMGTSFLRVLAAESEMKLRLHEFSYICLSLFILACTAKDSVIRPIFIMWPLTQISPDDN